MNMGTRIKQEKEEITCTPSRNGELKANGEHEST